MFLVSEDQIEHLRRSKIVLNLKILCITKLKALLSKSLSNPSVSSRVSTAWTYNCSLTQLLWKFLGNPKKNISGRAHTVSSNKHSRCLLNFETVRFLLEGDVYFKGSKMNNIIIKTLTFFFKIKRNHKFLLSINHYIIRGNTVFSIFSNLRLSNMLNISSVTDVFLWIFLKIFRTPSNECLFILLQW